MNNVGHIAYFTAGEDLNNPLLRRQVIELLCEIKRQHPKLTITLFSFLTIHTYLNHRKGLEQVRDILRSSGISLKIIPSVVPWPLPHYKLRKTDVGYRPYHLWDKKAAWLMGIIIWPVMVYYYLIRRVRIFHCRSYPPAYSAILFKKIFSKVKVIFDPRSDFPEENITSGNWGIDDCNYSFWKHAEELLLKYSDAVACIAPSYERAYRKIYPRAKCFLVPNNVACDKFKRSEASRSSIRSKLGILNDEVVFCYLGAMSSSGWHRADVYAQLCEILIKTVSKCRFLFMLPPHSNNLMRNSILSEACNNSTIIINAPFEHVPSYLSAADYGLMFLHKSKIAVGTKIGEYLTAGLPVIVNRNCIGACDLIKEKHIGLIIGMGLGDLDDCEYLGPLNTIATGDDLSKWSTYVADFAINYFDNTKIASAYYQQYDHLSC